MPGHRAPPTSNRPTASAPLPLAVEGAAADVTGTLVAVHFRDEGGFTIFSLESAGGTRVRALGHLPADIGLRAVIRLSGVWHRHPQFGWQLQFRTCELIDHLDRRGMVAFLAAYTTHLGPVRAAEAVALFGDRVFEVLQNTPEQLCVIKGITPTRAQTVRESFSQVSTIANLESWLRQIGLGKADARRVREAYGDDAASLIRENPYRLAAEIDGIGFITADSLRVMLGVAPTSPFRLHAALTYVLAQAARTEGHVFLPLADLVDRTARQLDEQRVSGGRWTPDPMLVHAVRAAVPGFGDSGDAVVEPTTAGEAPDDDARVYARDLHAAECEVAERLAAMLARATPLLPQPELDRALDEAQTRHALVLEADQLHALRTALTSQVAIISGGPGVGKTTSIRLLVDVLERADVSYMLLSPTGKAAKRLAEATLREAYTIHRQLFSLERQVEQLKKARARRSAKIAYLPAEVLVVDEASMLDLPLLAWLLRSIDPHARLIFVGDKDQLASVGPGSTLRDLIASDRVPVSLLTIIKRQGEGSPIVTAAHAINHGLTPEARSTPAGDLYIVTAKPASTDQGVHAQRIVVESAARLNAQVITPQHGSAVGVAALNRALQARLNPADPTTPEVQVSSDLTFRLGDRIIIGKNNYQTLCFNGETGDIIELGPHRLRLRMDDAQGERLVDYEREDWGQLQLAYAITSHRAQGSEWDNVVIVVSQSHYLMLQRNLVYTALTRARRRAAIIVSGGLENKQTGRIVKTALEIAVANDRVANRYSFLAERLNAYATATRAPTAQSSPTGRCR